MSKITWLWLGVLSVGTLAAAYSITRLRAPCCGGWDQDTAIPVKLAAESQPTANQPPGPESKAEFINARCPITGSAIDPAKVPDALTRYHNGRKVGFCCGNCPSPWDSLTDAQKGAKLARATAAAE